MRLFQLINLLYLSFHVLGFLMIIYISMPLAEQSGKTSKASYYLIKIAGYIISISWLIPILFISTGICFIINYTILGKIFSLLSLGIGVSMVLVGWTLQKQK